MLLSVVCRTCGKVFVGNLCRFLDLSVALEPGRPTKTNKPAILDDAIRVLNQLKTEAEELKQTNEKLREEVESLKVSYHI